MLKFIIDTQLPPKLSKHLSKKGLDAIHTTFFPDGHLLKDAEIRVIALKEERVIITKDNDFFDSFLAKGAPPQVLLFQFGNIKNKELLDHLDRELANILALLEANADLIIFDQNQLTVY